MMCAAMFPLLEMGVVFHELNQTKELLALQFGSLQVMSYEYLWHYCKYLHLYGTRIRTCLHQVSS